MKNGLNNIGTGSEKGELYYCIRLRYTTESKFWSIFRKTNIGQY